MDSFTARTSRGGSAAGSEAATGDRRDLDTRTDDGLHVRLLWNRVAVTVADARTGLELEVPVRDGERPLDVFQHRRGDRGPPAGNNTLDGGSGEDTILGQSHDDVLFARDGESDIAGCGEGSDTAYLDSQDGFNSCERRPVGVLRLAPKVVRADAGARLRLSWRHPHAWRKLRTIELRLTRDGAPVGEITIRPRAERITADGDGDLLRKRTRLRRNRQDGHRPPGAPARRKPRRPDSEGRGGAIDTGGRRQVERNAATVRVAA